MLPKVSVHMMMMKLRLLLNLKLTSFAGCMMIYLRVDIATYQILAFKAYFLTRSLILELSLLRVIIEIRLEHC